MIGQTIGQFRVDALAGEGGMGVVYRAFDTRLQRPVALKVLGAVLTDSPDARRHLFAVRGVAPGRPHGMGARDVVRHRGCLYNGL